MKNKLPDINHKTVVFTKHARERMDQRRVGEDMVIDIMRKSKTVHNLEDGKIKFIGKVMGAKVHAICKPIPEENKWLVISLWVRGENDAGEFVKHKKSYGKNRDATSKIYFIMFYIVAIFIAIVFYLSQMG